MNYQGYIQAYLPRKEELIKMLKEFKGEGRTMAEFSGVTGISTSTLSRILNGNLVKPLTEKTILAIYNNRSKDANSTLDQFFYANGMIRADKEDPDHISMSDVSRLYKEEERAKEIIILTLYRHGFGMRKGKNDNEIGGQSIILPRNESEGNDFMIPVDFSVMPDGIEGITQIYYRMCFDSLIKPSESISMQKDSSFLSIRDVLRKSAEVFLVDAWHPETLDQTVYTWVFASEGEYNSFKGLLSEAKLNSSMTVALVDIENKTIVKEEWLHCTISDMIETPLNTEV